MTIKDVKYFEYAPEVCIKLKRIKISALSNNLLSKYLCDHHIWNSIFNDFSQIKEESYKKRNCGPHPDGRPAWIGFPEVEPRQWGLYMGVDNTKGPSDYITINNTFGGVSLIGPGNGKGYRVEIQTESEEDTTEVIYNNFLEQYPSLWYSLNEVVIGLDQLGYDISRLKSDLKCLDKDIYDYSSNILSINAYFSE